MADTAPAPVTAGPAVVAEATADFTPVIIYGIVSEVMVVVPIILYMVTDGIPLPTLSANATIAEVTAASTAFSAAKLAKTLPTGYAKYHQTMINMMCSAWMPFAITWIIVLAADSPMARAALTGAMSMAGLGPFALQWVGLMSFIMAAHSAGNLGLW